MTTFPQFPGRTGAERATARLVAKLALHRPMIDKVSRQVARAATRKAAKRANRPVSRRTRGKLVLV